MNVRHFLEHVQKETLQSYAVICFHGKQYPLLFCSYYFSFLQKKGITVEHITVTNRSTDEAHMLFAMEGIAGPVTYWLSDLHTLTLKKQQEWLFYFQSYVGPHKIFLFCSDEVISLFTPANGCMVALDTIASRDFRYIRFLVNGTGIHATDFSRALAIRVEHVSLDTAILLAYYEVCIGASIDEFFSQWFMSLVESTRSLFLLSQYFFAKRQTLFFKQWALMAEQFAPQFWVVFWSDQLWNASLYCTLMRKKQQTHVKRTHYKLPFSFFNRDWSLYQPTELDTAYQCMYEIDFRLKNGGNVIALEYFYAQFFSGAFKKK